ncbi:hypothetical protein ACG873_04880 [Mesorhizobium sp. AaZ16]|uniref:hypothetical protein n=1 Tax=Mesorhizobium sp. AaZ16 TaxID=3402289 RepID=UPI00374EB5BB
MKIFSIGTRVFGQVLRTPRETSASEESWMLDPLSHPDVEAMTERELADLPFNRGYCGASECTGERRCG